MGANKKIFVEKPGDSFGRFQKAVKSESFENFDRLFRAIVSVPKSEVEKLEAKERAKNRRKRTVRKRQAEKRDSQPQGD